MEKIKLTQYSHGSGCGCKIAPKDLELILQSSFEFPKDENLIVGNDSRDDAAVYAIDNDQLIISTTDFFTPIVDDAFDFGKIAAANSISDVYAMGGKPIMAIAILGWPVGKIPNELAQKVLEGGKSICKEVGITLAGGHSIDSPEPFFGLAVTGITSKNSLKKNIGAKEGDLIYLTKPIGVGILSTAAKRGVIKDEDYTEAIKWMSKVNTLGEQIGKMNFVNAMTDVTGFGLLGHLLEVCKGSNVSAEINYNNVPLISGIQNYTSQFIYPDNTMRNWSSFQNEVEGITGESLLILSDPQTNGGLLVFVSPESQNEFESKLKSQGEIYHLIGKMSEKSQKFIRIS